MTKKLKRIESIEKELLNITQETPPKTFRNINTYQWIQNAFWPLGAYRVLSKTPLGNVLPAHPKLWINNLRIFFGNKTLNKRGYKNLTGYLLLFPFVKKKQYKVLANAFYFKRGKRYVVLFYTSSSINSVFKVVTTSKTKHIYQFKQEFSLEIEGQKEANKIKHPTVFTPKLKSYQLEGEIIFIEQEFIPKSKSLKYLSVSKANQILEEVFDFMLEFYKKNKLELKKLKQITYDKEKIEFVLDYYQLDAKIIAKYESLIQQKKKLIYGKIHGDLHYENILYTKEKKVCIIDWGKFKDAYWVEETINGFIYFPENLVSDFFYKIKNHFAFDINEMYTVKEQQFLIVCQQLFKRVSNEQLKPNKYLSNYISEQFKILKGNNLL